MKHLPQLKPAALGLAVAIGSAMSAAAHQDANNVNHWHSGGGGGGADTYTEEYPNGTTYYSGTDGKFVFSDEDFDGKFRTTNCVEEGPECKRLLEEAKKSGDGNSQKHSLEGPASTAVPLKDLFRGKPYLIQFLSR